MFPFYRGSIVDNIEYIEQDSYWYLFTGPNTNILDIITSKNEQTDQDFNCIGKIINEQKCNSILVVSK